MIMNVMYFVDNNTTSDETKLDYLWKLLPWIEQLQQNFSGISCDEHQSIDEIMVPFKVRSVLRMYLPKKPKEWVSGCGIVHHLQACFKIFVDNFFTNLL